MPAAVAAAITTTFTPLSLLCLRYASGATLVLYMTIKGRASSCLVYPIIGHHSFAVATLPYRLDKSHFRKALLSLCSSTGSQWKVWGSLNRACIHNNTGMLRPSTLYKQIRARTGRHQVTMVVTVSIGIVEMGRK